MNGHIPLPFFQKPNFPKINTSESPLLPPLSIVAESNDGKMYKIAVDTPRGNTEILVRTSVFTPQSDGNLTVLKADVVDILE
jgi:hypothetical protein